MGGFEAVGQRDGVGRDCLQRMPPARTFIRYWRPFSAPFAQREHRTHISIQRSRRTDRREDVEARQAGMADEAESAMGAYSVPRQKGLVIETRRPGAATASIVSPTLPPPPHLHSVSSQPCPRSSRNLSRSPRSSSTTASRCVIVMKGEILH